MGSNRTIQFILDNHYSDYKEKHQQPIRVIRAIEPQIRCRTKEQGSSIYVCAEDGETKEFYHSCRHKGCTICGEKRQNEWLESQKERLLNCPHYHLVFTLPQEYHLLWLYNRKWFINAQFKITSETLNDLLMGNTYKGKVYKGRLEATSGFISTLHTWGRSLNLHPHLHILMAAGGLNEKGEWKMCENDYLLPIKQVKALYRGKFQAMIKAFILSDDCVIPKNHSKGSLLAIHNALFKKEWSVNIQEKYEHGNGVLIYLSRYLGSNPIKPEQIKLINHNKEVIFSYWSHRDKKRKTERLTIDDFLKRYLVHQPEPNIHSIRYYGLYSSQAKKKREVCIALLGNTNYQNESRISCLINNLNEIVCDCCGAVMKLSYVIFKDWTLKNPLYREAGEIKDVFERFSIPKPSG
jgi:nitrite reductase/ring-hydroxylating ferredoxin subunit